MGRRPVGEVAVASARTADAQFNWVLGAAGGSLVVGFLVGVVVARIFG